MADSKITALTSIGASTDPANDPLVLVDVSDTSMAATGTTKKVTLNQLLGASGIATLASATITGDLTVDTSTLKVDSTNNRVIVGHTSGSAPFQVTNAGAAGLELHPTGASSAPLIISYNRSGLTYTQLTIDASTIVHQLSGSTAMTLNSTGLGVGMSPANNLSIGSTTYASFGVKIDSITQSSLIFKGTPDAVGYEHAKIVSGRESSPFTYGSFLAFYTEGKNSGTTDTSTERLRIDSSGNVGVGVTPSAWGAGYTAIQNRQTSWFSTSARDLNLGANVYVDGVGGFPVTI